MPSNLAHEKGSQPSQLITSLKLRQFLANRPLFTAKQGPEIADKKRAATHDIRAPRHLINRPEHLPQRVKPDVIGSFTQLEIGHEFAFEISRTHRPVMLTDFVGEGLSMPTFHSCRKHGNYIEAPTFDWNITSDFLEAFAPEQLARARDVVGAAESEVVGFFPFAERCPCETQLRILGKLAKQELIVIFGERNVRIQIADDVEAAVRSASGRIRRGEGQRTEDRGQTGVAGIEGVGFAGEMAVVPLGHSQQFYPIVLLRVTLDNLICAVSRAIADNDPFARQRCLRDD